MAPLGWLVARLTRAKLIVQMHGVEVWPQIQGPQRAAVGAADLVLCVSNHTRDCVLAWSDIAPGKVQVVPNTVRAIFTPGDGSALRAAWGLEGKRVLLTVSRLDSREQYKGHDRVIRAMPQLVAAGQDVAYVIIGEGDDLPRLRALADQVGVADRVHFKGAADDQILVEAYRMADLFVMPSTGEGFGIVFLEAMASGTPALGLAAAGAVDALRGLGSAVAEEDFPAELLRLLEAPAPDPDILAAKVDARFGGAAFTRGVHDAFDGLLQAS